MAEKEETTRVTMVWPLPLKEAVREKVGQRGLTEFALEAVRAKLGTHDSHQEDSKELNEVKFLVQRLADAIAVGGGYEDRESTLREIDLPFWVETTGWPEELARAINPESAPEPVEREPLARPSTAFERPPGNVHVIPEPLVDHTFEPGYSGVTCERMVMRDGAGDSCGLPVDAHRLVAEKDVDDDDLHRPMFMTPQRPEVKKLDPEEAGFKLEVEAPGVGDIVLKEPPKTSGGSLMDRVRAKAQEKGVDLSGIDLKPATEVKKLSPEEREVKLEQVRGGDDDEHNHSWKPLEDPHKIYASSAYVCDCGATMDSERVYEFGEQPADPSGLHMDDDQAEEAELEVQTEVPTEPAIELGVQPDAATSNACPVCRSPMVGDECWECF